MTTPSANFKRPHLMLTLPTLAGGGAERVVLRLAEQAAKHGFLVTLAPFHADGELVFDVPPGTYLVNLNVDGIAPAAAWLRNLIAEEKPDILISAMPSANIAALSAVSMTSAKHRPKVIVTEHSNPSISLNKGSWFKKQVLPRAVKTLYPSADGIVAVSEGSRDALAAFLPAKARDKVCWIPNPIDITPPENPATHPWLSEKDPERPVVVAVGRLTEAKDYPTMIEAFDKVHARRPEARLLIFGIGSERAALARMIAKKDLEDTIQLAGFSHNIQGEMRAADLFVLSSAWEGFGNVIVEALSVGLPVVSTDCDFGPGEILRRHGTGRLVPPKSPDALADAICAALDDPDGEGAKRPLQPGLEIYSPKEVFRRYLALAGVDLDDYTSLEEEALAALPPRGPRYASNSGC